MTPSSLRAAATVRSSRLAVLGLSLVVSLGVVVWLVGCGADAPEWVGEAAGARPAPALEGTNWDGTPFSLEQTRGKPTVVFFGFTQCPDICPMALAKLQQVESELGEQADDVEVVFVSVDPHRDTVERMAQYVPMFGDDFYGVRVEPEDIGDLQDRWDLTIQYGQPRDGPGTDSYYFVDHTGTFFLVDRAGEIRVTHPPSAGAEDLRPDIEALLTS